MTYTNAYVAGLIDGEGWIGVGTNKVFQARVTIGMTLPAKPVLVSLHEHWGGSLTRTRQATEKWAEAWSWSLQGVQAGALLEAIQPYLRIKRQQAALVLEVERLRCELPRRPNGSSEWNSGARARCQQIKDELHRLNAKGPRPARTAAVSMGPPLARWNPARGVWETAQTAICGHSEPFSETWPSSGMTRSGTAYELPMSVPRTDGSASSSALGLLPTPSVADSQGGHLNRSGDRSGELLLPGVAKMLASSPPPP